MKTRVEAALAALEAQGSAAHRDKLGPSFGIVTADRVIGAPMAAIQKIARGIGKDALRAFAKAGAKGTAA